VDDRQFGYLLAVVLVVCVVVVVRLRRGLTGLGLAAVRGDEDASRSIGLSPMAFRVAVFALSSFIAGVGGALLGIFQLYLQPADLNTSVGLVWLAVVVTQGVRSPLGALIGGLAWAVIPAALSSLPSAWAQLPAVLFGLGAVALAREPDGMITATERSLAGAAGALPRLFRRQAARPAADAVPVAAGQPQLKGDRP
jgi:branched-chain amino acid transport system permease protein